MTLTKFIVDPEHVSLVFTPINDVHPDPGLNRYSEPQEPTQEE